MKQRIFIERSFAIILGFLFLGIPPLSLSQQLTIEHLTKTTQSEILSISTDEEAITVFMKEFGQTFEAPPMTPRKSKKPRAPHLPATITQQIPQLMANLIISIRAKRMQSFIQPNGISSLEPLLQKETVQSQWLLSKPHSDGLNQLMDLAKAIDELSPNVSTGTMPSPQKFEVFASYFDQEYPELTGSQTSWVGILENEGASGVHVRFNEFWDTHHFDPASTERNSATPLLENKEAYAQQYLNTRLLPVFSSHLIARSIHLQASAEVRARQSWTHLKEWNHSQQHSQAVTRLCGTWHWTVHNHQNHRDHKMTLSFLPPSQQDTGHPQPDSIIIHGNTVFLRWKFPSGFQEDSLLLSHRDQRLEGTFANSLGARGTITGKRLSTCTR